MLMHRMRKIEAHVVILIKGKTISGSPVQRVLEAGIDVEEVVRIPYVQIKIKMFQMFVGTCVSKNMI